MIEFGNISKDRCVLMSLGSESGFADTEFKESSGIRFSSSVTAEILKITDNGILFTFVR